MSDTKNSGAFSFPGVAVIMLALGVFIFTDNPFQPTRPNVSNNLKTQSENVLSRLWQDPFEAVQLHIKNKHKDEAPQQSTSSNNLGHSIESLRLDIQRGIQRDIIKGYKDENKFDLHVLAILINGGPYAENKENRIRSRYALTTSLLNVGYIPADSEHINYLDISNSCDTNLSPVKKKSQVKNTHCNWPDIIPYEWYKSEELSTKWNDYGFSKKLLILWIDEQKITAGSPLNMLSALKEELSPKKGTIDSKEKFIKYDIVGPASSSTLIKMYENLATNKNTCNKLKNNCVDLNNKYGDNKQKIRVFSPRATLDKHSIETILHNKNIIPIDSPIKFPGLHRTLATDAMLVDTLLCEMLRRGINPFNKKLYIEEFNYVMHTPNETKCTNYSLNSLNKSNLINSAKKDYIVLIGEGDTTYSRNFNFLFRKKITQHIQKYNDKHKDLYALNEIKKADWLLSFNYLRGLDGEIANKARTIKPKKNNTKDKDAEKEFRRPVGANQFDYLRRLSKQITDLAKERKDEGTIRAIGIVGSDTYDKLLILQALRNKFPGVLFFTTDLDARLLHPDENKWSRNLIVASAFGLTPENKGITYKGLPFRDSYQTAFYNTIQKVLFRCDDSSPKTYKHCKKTAHNTDSTDDVVSVKLFEIGNKSAIDYSHEIHSETPESKEATHKATASHYKLYLFLVLIFITLISFQTNNEAKFYISTAVLLISTVIIWLSFYPLFDNKEFEHFFTGTSIWPAYIMRMTAFITALFFIIYAIIYLKYNRINIIKKYNLSDKNCINILDKLRDQFKETEINTFKKYLSIIPDALNWIFYYDCYDDKTISNRKLKKPSRLSCLLITTWGWKDKSNADISIDNLFYQYTQLNSPPFWFIRVSTITIIYILFSYVFLESFHSRTIEPFVGETNAEHMYLLMNAVYIPYAFLIFFVSDITRVNLRFVDLLSKYNVTCDKISLTRYCNTFGLTPEIAIEKLKLDLIILRSSVVDHLIFLPFIILTLIILSKTSYFDRWHTPPELIFIILLGACIALSSAIRLRLAAKKARKQTLKKLKEIYKQQIYIEDNPRKQINETYDTTPHKKIKFMTKVKNKQDIYKLNKSKILQDLITEIENMSAGPFLPLSKHPIITAVAMPFGGVGGLYLIEYLSSVGI